MSGYLQDEADERSDDVEPGIAEQEVWIFDARHELVARDRQSMRGPPRIERTADELDTRIGVLLAQLNQPEEDPHGRSDRQRALSRR